MTLKYAWGKGKHLSDYVFLNKMGEVQHLDFFKCEAVSCSGTTLRGNIPKEQRFWTKDYVKFRSFFSVGSPAVTGWKLKLWRNVECWGFYSSLSVMWSSFCSLVYAFWVVLSSTGLLLYELILASSGLTQVWDRPIATCFFYQHYISQEEKPEALR